jgi:predicted nucleic acid-binding protein
MCWFPAFSLPGLSPRGNEPLILLAIHQGLIHPCFSEEMLEEMRLCSRARTLRFHPTRSHLARSLPALAMLRQQGKLYHPTASLAASVDPGDTKFLQCAEAARADYIVIGNKRHFPEPADGVTSIVSAGELLDRITREI